ncbi:MAG: aconitate hydratase AcnA, partial [Candidatus Solibacter sp.]|nr:aconitate hydratase AcnA [Candidatus Solibacter sp.]
FTNRDAALVALVEAYTKEQGLFRTDQTADPVFADTLELDLSTVMPSMAGPKRPQDRVELPGVARNFHAAFPHLPAPAPDTLGHGAVVIAAITSCTNTSNPSVMLAAGLVAKKAVERGLKVKPWVKTSLAPGSKVVADYYREAGLMTYLEQLNFHLVGFGCTTCIGNSGPLPDAVTLAVRNEGLVVAAVISGNRNFEGRINPLVKANYLASPPLVVAYALAGSMDIDLTTDPLGEGSDGQPVFLRDIWPSNEEVASTVRTAINRGMFEHEYAHAFDGDQNWQSLSIPTGGIYHWDDASTYIKKPPYFDNMADPNAPLQDFHQMRVLALLGDSVTTDHISPAGSIPKDSPAGKYLIAQGVQPADFNSYGARRGNHEVMVRGTLANIRLRNQLAPGTEGGLTRHLPEGEQMFIYDAAMKYQTDGVPLLIVAGKEYGSGSSRDWAAKGVLLLGVRAVIAESFERIHRTNLVGMGVLPLQFQVGESAASLGLTGDEVYHIEGVASSLNGGGRTATLRAVKADGTEISFTAVVRVDTPQEVEYYRNGGILPYVLRQLAV